MLAESPFVLSMESIERFGTEEDDFITVRDPDPDSTLVETYGGNDIIRMGDGNSVVYAGDGDDGYRVLNADEFYGGAAVFDGGDGKDTLDLSMVENADTDDGSSGMISSVTVDLQKELAGGSIREAGGNNPQDTWGMHIISVENVIGTYGTDVIKGNSANNALYGRGDDDVLKGGAGRDKIFGGAGNDKLFDGDGKDNMFGGEGTDTFVMAADGTVDSIKDFEASQDILDLSAWGVTSIDALHFRAIDRGQGKLIVSYEDESLTLASRSGAVLEADLTGENLLI